MQLAGVAAGDDRLEARQRVRREPLRDGCEALLHTAPLLHVREGRVQEPAALPLVAAAASGKGH